MHIAVIGAGIAGLVAACGLQRDRHDVTVYEQRPDPSADGAGLTLFGNGFAALDAVGLGDVVRGVSSNAIATMQAGQRAPDGEWMVTLPPGAVATLHSVHRVSLHEALVAQLVSGSLETATTAEASPDGSAMVWIDGSPIDYDLVIIADGLRSRNRHALGLDTGLSYAGYTAWRGVTDRPVDLNDAAGETWGRGSIFGIVPLPDDRLYWFGTLTTAADTIFADDFEVLQQIFGRWHDPIPACLTATPPNSILRHDVYELAKPLATFRRGYSVLMGDAAHAMTPNLGQGAGQGIEDAATLSMLLRGAHREDLDQVLTRYSALRRKRTTSLLRQSHWMSNVAQASGSFTGGIRDVGMRLIPDRIAGVASAQMQSWSPPR